MARWLNDTEYRAWIGYRRMRLLLDAEVARDLLRGPGGLSAPDYDVLSALSSAADRRQRLSALAARMLWSKSRLSRHIGRMEMRGLVVRVEDADDGRRADVVLTEKGERAIVEAAPAHVESVREHFIDLLTEEQLRVLGDVAEIVLARLPRSETDDT
ncbi:MAG: MarR family winged helix-turn-helix transcriptional regulator [Spirillospora sp.]